MPKEIIDKAVGYIRKCTTKEGGVQYSSKGGGGRPAITAAAIACLSSAGEYDDDYFPRMLKYCEGQLGSGAQANFGHWHYAHFYYSQVQYRIGSTKWRNYRDVVYKKLLQEAKPVHIGDREVVYWDQGYIGPIYTTSLNLIILQLENAYLPIYQR